MGAIAAGKVNASEAQAGMRIIVKVSADGTVRPSSTKTGEGVQVARIIEKGFRAAGRYEARGKYVIETTAGPFDAAPIQTMWLAPEDPAGIKRAHAEALAAEREIEELAAEREIEERAAEVEAANLADAEAARDENEAQGAIYHGTEWASSPDDLPDPDGSNTLPIPAGPWFDPEAGASAPESNRHPAQTGGVEDLTLNSHDGKVMDMNNDASTETPAQTREMTGSAVVRLMEKVHARIRQNHPGVPEVVIVTGAGTGPLGGKWGHFRPQGWEAKDEDRTTKIHEMFMAGETLAKGARQVLQTMLHESAHAECEANGVQDTSRQGRWHNKAFLSKAREFGLEYRKDKANPQIGYSEVVLTDETIEEYADLLAELDTEIHLMVRLPGWLGGDQDDQGESNGGEGMGKAPKTGPAAPNTNNIKCVCRCEEPNIIRMSRKVLDQAVVNCGDCDSLFSAA